MWGEVVDTETDSGMDLVDLCKDFDAQVDDEPADHAADSSINAKNFMDDMLVHTVQLLQYKRYALKIKDDPSVIYSITDAQVYLNKIFVKDIQRKQMCIAKLPEMRRAKPVTDDHLPMILNQTETYSILRKVVALLAAHVGFHDAEAEALECVTDVAATILEKLGQTFSECQKRRDLNLESAGQSAVEQTLHFSGINDVQVLFDYYDNKIRKYRDRLMIDCSKLQSIILSTENPSIDNNDQ